ncbi:MAG: cold-shock protein [Candidatus Scalindua sp.]
MPKLSFLGQFDYPYSKGFGFITQDDGADAFAHYSDDSFKSLAEGDVVSFDVVEGDKGPKATNIEKL